MISAVEKNGVGKPMAIGILRGGSSLQLQVIPTEIARSNEGR